MQLRGFVMIRTAESGWTVSVCRDLDAVMTAWREREADSVGVLHVGFDRPPSSAFDAVASGHCGRMLLTAAARFSLPSGYAVHPEALGEAAGLPIFLATSGFGYAIDPDMLPPLPIDKPTSAPAFHGWLAMFVGRHPEYADALATAGISGDDSYLAREETLDRTLRHDLGRFRFAQLVGTDDSDPAWIARCAPPWLQSMPLDMLPLTVRIANVMTREKIATVGELVRFEPHRLMHTQNFGRTSFHGLRTMLLEAIEKGPVSDEDAYDAAGAITLREGMNITLARLDGRERDILARRMGLFDRAETLAEIGESHEVSRERIRQIEAKIVRRIIDEDRWDNLLTRKLRALLEGRVHPLPVVGVEAIDPWFTGIAENGDALAYILENICGDRFHVVTVDDVPYFATFDQERWTRCQREARALLAANAKNRWDEDHCRSVVASVLDLEARAFSDLLWDAVRKDCHFAREGDRTVLAAFGRNIEALVEAILTESDRPLHFTEIAAAVAERTPKDFDVRRVHNAAQEIGFLFGRGLYGLDRHCRVEPETREVCRAEVERIVEEGPAGRQWHCTELCQALADEGIEADGLDKYALEIILRQSASLVRLGRLTWSGKSGEGTIVRTGIRPAIVAILREAGGPLPTSEITDRLNAVRGTNDVVPLWNFDPVIRLARGLWGLNDRDVPINRETQRALFANLAQRLAEAGSGIFVEDVFDQVPQLAMTCIDADLLCALAAHNPQVKVNGDRVFYLSEWGHARRETLGKAVIEVLGASPHGIGFDDLVDAVKDRTGRNFDRVRISAHLQKCGIFDPIRERWTLAAEEDDTDEPVDTDFSDGTGTRNARVG